MKKLNPPQVIVCSFLTAILIGTILLCLPVSTSVPGSINVIDALFTSSSAICVTGLIVKDTGTFFSPFGQFVILVLFQLGGLGIMTFSVLMALLLGRKVSITGNTVLQTTITGSSNYFKSLSYVLKNVVKLVFAIEISGAFLLFLRFQYLKPREVIHNLYSSVFHSVSAFCNAGFSLYKTSFMEYSSDIYINLIISFLIIAGGLGFIVLLSIPSFKIWKKNRKNILAKINLQSKIVLIISVVLIISGIAVLFILEYDNVLKGLSLKDKILGSYFQSVTSRTAGFNTLDIGKLTFATQFFLIVLMFIGASPGSTGSGIKTTTFAVLIAVTTAMFKNKNQVSLFSRTVPKEIVREAILIFMFSVSWVTCVVFILLISQNLFSNPVGFTDILFETVSAFGNVGLSTGITSGLNYISKFFIIVTMFIGRIGPLTLAWAVILHKDKIFYKYPEEKIMVG